MKEIYDRYLEHFVKVNAPTEDAFNRSAKEYSAWAKDFLPRDKNARILDIGCGMGHFLYFLKKEGYNNFFGIDISRQQVNFTKENVTKNVAVADAFDYLRENKNFHVIVANDIIEHLPKERVLEFLHLIFSSLERGVAFVKTGNMSNPFNLRTRYVDFTHETGFTEQSLHAVLNIAGFQEIRIIGSDYPIKPFPRALRRKMIHAILRWLFLWQGQSESEILDKNIIAIATKK